MAFYAHSVEGRPESAWQPLAEHLRNVAQLARTFAQEARPGDDAFAQAAYAAGLLHDLGKTPVARFGLHLAGRRISKNLTGRRLKMATERMYNVARHHP